MSLIPAPAMGPHAFALTPEQAALELERRGRRLSPKAIDLVRSARMAENDAPPDPFADPGPQGIGFGEAFEGAFAPAGGQYEDDRAAQVRVAQRGAALGQSRNFLEPPETDDPRLEARWYEFAMGEDAPDDVTSPLNGAKRRYIQWREGKHRYSNEAELGADYDLIAASIGFNDLPMGQEIGRSIERTALQVGQAVFGAAPAAALGLAESVGLPPQPGIRRELQKNIGGYDTLIEGAAPSPSVALGGAFDPTSPRWWASNAPGEVVVLAGQVAATLYTGGVGALAAAGFGGLREAGEQYKTAYEELVRAGVPDQVAHEKASREAGVRGAVSTVLEKLGLDEIARAKVLANPAVRSAARQAFGDRLAQYGSKVVRGGVGEGVTEGLQSGTGLALGPAMSGRAMPADAGQQILAEATIGGALGVGTTAALGAPRLLLGGAPSPAAVQPPAPSPFQQQPATVPGVSAFTPPTPQFFGPMGPPTNAAPNAPVRAGLSLGASPAPQSGVPASSLAGPGVMTQHITRTGSAAFTPPSAPSGPVGAGPGPQGLSLGGSQPSQYGPPVPGPALPGPTGQGVVGGASPIFTEAQTAFNEDPRFAVLPEQTRLAIAGLLNRAEQDAAANVDRIPGAPAPVSAPIVDSRRPAMSVGDADIESQLFDTGPELFLRPQPDLADAPRPVDRPIGTRLNIPAAVAKNPKNPADFAVRELAAGVAESEILSRLVRDYKLDEPKARSVLRTARRRRQGMVTQDAPPPPTPAPASVDQTSPPGAPPAPSSPVRPPPAPSGGGVDGAGARPGPAPEPRRRAKPERKMGTADRPVAPQIALFVSDALEDGVALEKTHKARDHVAKGMGLPDGVPAGTTLRRIVDDAIEFGGVITARGLIQKMQKIGDDAREIFDALREWHLSKQPPGGEKSSIRVQNQAYSTPLPIAFVAAKLARTQGAQRVYEPSAGTGMLLIDADPKNVEVVEIDPTRREILEASGFTLVGYDATAVTPAPATYDSIIMNPPFGLAPDKRRWNGPFEISTNKRDQIIAAVALNGLTEDGNAVLILMGPRSLDAEAVRGFYRSPINAAFFTKIHDNFNVVKHVVISGDLYRRQGAGWPVVLIQIEGRGRGEMRAPIDTAPPMIRTWDELKGLLPDVNENMDAADRGGSVDPAGDRAQTEGSDGPRRPDRGSVGADDAALEPRGADGGAGAAGVGGRGGDAAADGAGVGGADAGAAGDAARPNAPRPAAADMGGPAEGDAASANEDALGGRGGAVGAGDAGADGVGDGGQVGGDQTDAGAGVAEPDPSIVRDFIARITKNNKGVKTDEALELLDDLDDLLGGGGSVQLNMGVDPVLMAKLAKFGFAFLEAGYRRFMAWSRQMIALLNKHAAKVAPFLQEVYNGLRSDPRVNDSEMSSEAAVAADVQSEEFGLLATGGVKPDFTKPQTPYTVVSGVPEPIKVLAPTTIADQLKNSLQALQDRVGPLDRFVMSRLQYPPEQKVEALFSGVQVDTIALAIDAHDRNAGLVVGHMTGVGKGRVGAAMLRYARVEGLIPVFFTASDVNYPDMVRDLRAIGEHPNILFTDQTGAIPIGDRGEEMSMKSPEGRHIKSAPKRAAYLLQKTADDGKLPGNHTVIFSKYSQYQQTEGTDSRRTAPMQALAPRAFFVLDESHNAGSDQTTENKAKRNAAGDRFVRSSRGVIMRGMIEMANGTLFMSATHAKRAELWGIYAGALGLIGPAGATVKEVISTIKDGGIVLQQLLAAGMASGGLYTRAELDLEGIKFDYEELPGSREEAKKIVGLARRIRSWDINVKTKVIEGIHAGTIGGLPQRDPAQRIESSTFGAVFHVITNSMLVAAKIDAIADRMIELIAAGKKPIFYASFTGAATVEAFMREEGLSFGDEVDVDFSAVLQRYVRRGRLFKYRDFSEKQHPGKITDDMIIEALGADKGLKAIAEERAIIQAIKDADLSKYQVSPFDWIAKRLADAGYSVGEITARSVGVDYTGPGRGVLAKRNSAATRRDAINGFNNGGSDALVMNAGTGFDLHSSSNFKDQRQRVMLVVEANPNVDSAMQTFGRINRRGQVNDPAYVLVGSELPYDRRPMAALMRRLSLLNANTTADKGGAIDISAPDYFTPLGEQVFSDMLEENRDLNMLLGDPFGHYGNQPVSEPVNKSMGLMALLDPDDADQVFAELDARYDDALRESGGVSGNEIPILDVKARTLSTQLHTPGVPGSANPFDGDLNIETVDALVLTRPMTPAQVLDRQREWLGVEGDRSPTAKDGQRWVSDLVAKIAADTVKYLERREAKRAEENPGEDDFNDKKNANERKDAAYRLSQITTALKTIAESVEGGIIDSKEDLHLVMPIGFDTKDFIENPVAASRYRVRFAVADSTRQITASVSQLIPKSGGRDAQFRLVASSSTILGSTVISQFETGQRTATEVRSILTGNILRAMNEANQANTKGRAVYYTNSEGRVNAGVLMARGFDNAEFILRGSVQFSKPLMVGAFFTAAPKNAAIRVHGAPIHLALTVNNPNHDRWERWEFRTSADKMVGGQTFLDPDLIRKLAGWGLEFTKSRSAGDSGMVVHLTRQQANEFLAFLYETKGVRFSYETGIHTVTDSGSEKVSEPMVDLKNLARKIAGLPVVQLAKKKLGEKGGDTLKAMALGAGLYGLQLAGGEMSPDALIAAAGIFPFIAHASKRSGSVAKAATLDFAGWLGSWYSEPVIDMFASSGRARTRAIARRFREVIDRANVLRGELEPDLNRTLRMMAGRPGTRGALKALNTIHWVHGAGAGETLLALAVEDRLPAGVTLTPLQQKMVDEYRNLVMRTGAMAVRANVQVDGRAFTPATGGKRFLRHFSPEMWEIMQTGESHPMWLPAAQAISDANGIPLAAVLGGMFKPMVDMAVGSEGMAGATVRRDNFEFRREIPRMPTHFKGHGDRVVPILRSDPYVAARDVAEHAIHRLSYLEQFGQGSTTGVWTAHQQMRRQVKAATGSVQLFDDIVRMLHGVPLKGSMLKRPAAGTVHHDARRYLGAAMQVLAAAKLSTAAIVNLPETMGAVPAFAGGRAFLGALADIAGRPHRIGAMYEELAERGALTHDVADYSMHASRRANSVSRSVANVVLIPHRLANEMNELVSAKAGERMARRLAEPGRPLGIGDEARLRMLNYDNADIRRFKMKAASPRLLLSVEQRMTERTQGTTSHLVQQSQANQVWWFNSMVWFDRYFRMKLNRTAVVASRVSVDFYEGVQTRDAKKVAGAGKIAAEWLVGHAAAGGAASLLVSFMFGGVPGLLDEWDEATADPALWLRDALMYSLVGGPLTALLEYGEGAEVGRVITRAIMPLNLAQELGWFLHGGGPYRDMPMAERPGELFNRQVPVSRAGARLLAAFGVGSADGERDRAVSEFWRWRMDKPLEEKDRVFRAQMKSAVEAMQADDYARAKQLLTKAGITKDPSAVRASLMGRRRVANLSAAEKRDLVRAIGQGRYTRLLQEDQMLEAAAQRISPGRSSGATTIRRRMKAP